MPDSFNKEVEIIMRDGLAPENAVGKPPHPGPDYEERRENSLWIERNVRVPMRDGIHILVRAWLCHPLLGETK